MNDICDKIFNISYDNEITNNNIFYHCYCINDYWDRFLRTYTKIKKSGLINYIDKMYINAVGSLQNEMINKIKDFDPKIEINQGINSQNESETLNILLDYCKSNTTGKSLYLHCKGVARCFRRGNFHKKQNVQDWIDCMEYFLIEEFDNCLSVLENYDNCGVSLMIDKTHRRPWFTEKDVDTSWYSGNFWWARNDYISTLDICKNLFHYCEDGFLRPHKSRFKQLYNIPVSTYRNRHKRESYTKKESLV